MGALTLLTFKHARGLDQNNSMEPSLAHISHISTYIITIAISSQYPGCPLKNQQGFHRSPNSWIPQRETRQDPPWLPGVENEFALPQAVHRSWKAWEVVVRAVGPCATQDVQKCKHVKDKSCVSFQGNDHFKRKVCWSALSISIHFTKKNLSRISKCSTSEGKFVSVHPMSTVL